jgi:hypothetical protein
MGAVARSKVGATRERIDRRKALRVVAAPTPGGDALPIPTEEAQEMEGPREEALDKAWYLSKGNDTAEVDAWLVQYLPLVRRVDAEEYCKRLIDCSFDSNKAPDIHIYRPQAGADQKTWRGLM